MDSQAQLPKQDDGKLHIVLFPWLAFGHMIPYLELAKLIAQRGHRVSFVSTPRNIDRLPKLPPNLISCISFVKLPLPHVPNVPEDAESTTDLPENKVQFLKLAYNLLQEAITGFLDAAAPDWVLHDFTAYWLPPIATKLGISCGFFSIFTASTLCCIDPSGQDQRTEAEEFTVSPKWVPFPSTVAFRYFEVMKIFNHAILGDASGASDMHRFFTCLRGCDLLAVRSCEELEAEWLRLLEELYRKPVVPVGQLPPILPHGGDDDKDESWPVIKGWLEKQAGGSVVYVAFGSEATPNQTELAEIALGLELCGLPFFWVLKLRRGGPSDTEVLQLPEGFEDRTQGRGVVCTSWAPQLKILSHPSVGGFLSHSGWTSVVEALQLEIPLILLTFSADQGLNASFLREKKIGYLIPRNEQDGWFTQDAVAHSLRLVMDEEGGKIYRDKAKEMRKIFGDRDRQNQYLDAFVNRLKEHRHYSSTSTNV